MTTKTDFEAELAYAENGNYRRQSEFAPIAKSMPAQTNKYAAFRDKLTFLTKSIRKSDPDQSLMPQMGNEAMPGLPAASEGDIDALLAELMGGADTAMPAGAPAPIAAPEVSDAAPDMVAGKDNEAIPGEELVEELKALLQDPNASEEEIMQLVQQIIESGVMTIDEVMALVEQNTLGEGKDPASTAGKIPDGNIGETEDIPIPAAGKRPLPPGEGAGPIPDFNSLF